METVDRYMTFMKNHLVSNYKYNKDDQVFDEVRNNAILAAILVYMACEDPQTTPRDKAVLPINPRTGEPGKWPAKTAPTRKGGM